MEFKRLNKLLNIIQENLFSFTIIIIYILIVVSFFGFSKLAPEMLSKIDYYFRIYICLFLIWRFNPFRKVTYFTDLDRKIAYNAGLFILTTTFLNNYINYLKTKVANVVKNNSNNNANDNTNDNTKL